MNANVWLVVSDSHGETGLLQRAIDLHPDAGGIIHCGDGSDDLLAVETGSREIIAVAGNVDVPGSSFPRERTVQLNGFTLLVIHGDQVGVKYSLDMLLERGVSDGLDLLCFGHTHIQEYVKRPLRLFNPGAISQGLYGLLSFSPQFSLRHSQL